MVIIKFIFLFFFRSEKSLILSEEFFDQSAQKFFQNFWRHETKFQGLFSPKKG